MNLDSLQPFLFGLYALNYWRFNFFQDSVPADDAFCFPAAEFQFFRWDFCAASHTLVDNSCFFHGNYLLATKEKYFAFKCFQSLNERRMKLENKAA